MYQLKSPNPKEYAAKRSWTSLRVPKSIPLNPLERAVLHYTSLSSATKNGYVYDGTAYHPNLQQMVFYYLKANEPETITGLIEANLKKLDGLGSDTWVQPYKRQVETMKGAFEKLKITDVQKVEYDAFEIPGFGNLLSGGQTPFKHYCGKMVAQLKGKGLLKSKESLGRKYISVS